MSKSRDHDAHGRDSDVPSYEGADRRVGLQAVRQWLALHETDATPELAEIIASIDGGLSPFIFILKEDWDPRLSIFVECGEEVRLALGGSPLRSTLWQAVPEPIRPQLCDACVAAIREHGPVFSEGSYQLGGDLETRFRSVFLPLRASSYPKLGYLLGTHRIKKFPPPPKAK